MSDAVQKAELDRKLFQDAPPRRRWFRYSLRTLFVMVTVLGVWLGIQVLFVVVTAFCIWLGLYGLFGVVTLAVSLSVFALLLYLVAIFSVVMILEKLDRWRPPKW